MTKKQLLTLSLIFGVTLTFWIQHASAKKKFAAQKSSPAATAKNSAAHAYSRVNTTLAKVEPGDNVLAILHKYGFTDTASHDALVASKLPKDFLLAPGETYRVARSKTGRVDLRFFDRERPRAYHFWRDGKKSGGELQKIHFDVRTVTVSGHVDGSLVASVAAAIGDELTAYRFMDAFLLDYNLPKVLRRNAPFKISYEKLYEDGMFVRYGEVRRAELEINGHNVIRTYKPLHYGGIFFAAGFDSVPRPFYAPVDHIRISSLFNLHRYHPIEHRYIPHLGIDFEVDAGSPIYAAANGTVVRFGRNHAAGRFVVVRHTNGYESFYDHLSEIADIHPGEAVPAGQVLGYAGCSGYCTRPHLHFAVKKRGRFINPIRLIRGYAFNQRHEIALLISKSD